MNIHNPGDARETLLTKRFGPKVSALMLSVPPAVLVAFREIVAQMDEEARRLEATVADLEADNKDLTALRGMLALVVRKMGGAVEFRQGELREVAVGSVLSVAKKGRGDGPGVEMVLSLRPPDRGPATTDIRPGS